MDFGNGQMIRSTVQYACRYTPQILDIDQANASGFCLTTDQLSCFSEKLSRCLPKIILEQILKSCHCLFRDDPMLEEWYSHSPNCQIHIQIFHRIAKLSSADFPDHGEDTFHVMGCVRRSLEIVVPCRFCILLTFLVN